MTITKLDFDSRNVGPDGFARIQRAVVRQLAGFPEGLRCSHLIRRLLEDRGCAREMTAKAIDITMLAMSHPRLSYSPILEYLGSVGADNGFIPGSTYRSIALGTSASTICESFASTSSAWEEAPLKTRMPYILVAGAASWRASYDNLTSVADQRGVKIWCNRIHCLGSPMRDVYHAYSVARGSGRSDFLKKLLRFRIGDTVLACFPPWQFLSRVSQKPAGANRVGMVSEEPAFPGCLPYGGLVSLSWASTSEGGASRVRVVSSPRVEIEVLADGTTVLSAIQAACGMEFGRYWGRICPIHGAFPGTSSRKRDVGTRSCRASKRVIDTLAAKGRTEVPLSPIPLAEYERIFL